MLPFWRKQVYPYDNIHKLKSLIPFYSLPLFSLPSSKWFTCHFVKLLVSIFGNAHQILANSFFLSLWTSAPGWKMKRTANYLSLKLLISTTILLHPPSPRTVETNFWTILSSPFLVFRRVMTAVHNGGTTASAFLGWERQLFSGTAMAVATSNTSGALSFHSVNNFAQLNDTSGS